MATIEILRTYKSQSENKKSELDSVADKKAIIYAATLLESEDVEILSVCLDILENYAEEKSAHSFLLTTFGVYESIEALAIRTRDKNKNIYQRAMKITNKLRNSTSPAYNTRNRLKSLKSSKKHNLYILYIEGLNGESLLRLEERIVKIKGVVSFVVDIDMKRCTIRISSKIEIKEIVDKISKKTGLKCFIIVKNKITGLEEYVDVLKKLDSESYFEYPEDGLSPNNNAVTEPTKGINHSGNSFIKSIVNYWNEALYW